MGYSFKSTFVFYFKDEIESRILPVLLGRDPHVGDELGDGVVIVVDHVNILLLMPATKFAGLRIRLKTDPFRIRPSKKKQIWIRLYNNTYLNFCFKFFLIKIVNEDEIH